jgi:hypothetical protein
VIERADTLIVGQRRSSDVTFMGASYHRTATLKRYGREAIPPGGRTAQNEAEAPASIKLCFIAGPAVKRRPRTVILELETILADSVFSHRSSCIIILASPMRLDLTSRLAYFNDSLGSRYLALCSATGLRNRRYTRLLTGTASAGWPKSIQAVAIPANLPACPDEVTLLIDPGCALLFRDVPRERQDDALSFAPPKKLE